MRMSWQTGPSRRAVRHLCALRTTIIMAIVIILARVGAVPDGFQKHLHIPRGVSFPPNALETDGEARELPQERCGWKPTGAERGPQVRPGCGPGFQTPAPYQGPRPIPAHALNPRSSRNPNTRHPSWSFSSSTHVSDSSCSGPAGPPPTRVHLRSEGPAPITQLGGPSSTGGGGSPKP